MSYNTKVRFAPSPTGFLHLGGVRTALYNYLFAKQNKGQFILRIEDTDQGRLVEGSVDNLISSLHKLGLNYDEGPGQEGENAPYFQSERLDIYRQHAMKLVEQDKAYFCFCSKNELEEMRSRQLENNETTKYNGKCRDLSLKEIAFLMERNTQYVIRLKMPQDHIFIFNDLVRGKVHIDSELIEDQIILKSDGFPTYHLAAVVDDHYMNISHVFRGEEWLYSTPKHIFIYESLGWDPPLWVHLPLLLNTDKSKLSKRHGDFSVSNYLERGYLKEAIINFVALLGWHSADDRELFTLEELITEFSLARITKSGAVFDLTKLDWMNAWYIRNLPLEDIAELCKPYFLNLEFDISDQNKYYKVIKRTRDQITKLPEIVDQAKVFYQEFVVSPEGQDCLLLPDSQQVLKWMYRTLQSLNFDSITELLKQCSQELNIKGKNLYFPLRIALFGDCHGPDIPLLIDILGTEESLKRIAKWI